MRYRMAIDRASTFHWSSLRFTHEDLLWLTYNLFILLTPAQSGLCRSETGDWNAERRATHIIQPDFIAELDALRITAMFATDTHFQVRIGCTSLFYTHAHEL